MKQTIVITEWSQDIHMLSIHGEKVLFIFSKQGITTIRLLGKAESYNCRL